MWLELPGTVTGTFVARAALPPEADAPMVVPALTGAVEALRYSAGMMLPAAA